MSPDPARVARFRGDVEAAAGRALRPDEPLALAVSGGPDSMAMLALAHAAYPGRVIAATFDHRLRAESADEAAMVAEACEALGIPHQILAPLDELPKTNVQAAARNARYAALRRWTVDRGAWLLATAHHADDQAETFLMRANRGSGIAGLAGIRARHDSEVMNQADPSMLVYDVFDVATIRPLLGWRRAMLRDVVTGSGLPFVDDPSNSDPQFDRVAVRDFLKNQNLLDPAQLARSAGHLAHVEADLRAMGAWLWKQRSAVPADAERPDEDVWLDMADLPRELKRRLSREAIHSVRLVIGTMRPEFTDATNIEALLDALESGSRATQAGILVSATGTIWHFREAPPRRAH